MCFANKLARPALAALALCRVCVAQTPAPAIFDVATVRVADDKPPYTPIAAAGVIKGGPGTDDPARISYTWVLARRLLMEAFGMPLDQISGPDAVMGQQGRFNITATVPAGSSKEQVREMLLNLLKERFHLAYHTQKKDFDEWVLTVAKGGSKLKDAAPPEGAPPPPPQPGTPLPRAELDNDGFPILPAGRQAARGVGRDGAQYVSFRMSTPQLLLNMLQFDLGGRTEDRTGLTGKYDFHLEYSAAGLPGPFGRGGLRAAAPGGGVPEPQSDPAPDLFSALEKQLGLKLEKSKTTLDVYVIDHMDKTPADN